MSVFLKLTQSDSVSFLLESVEGGEQIGRYSFLGVQPKGVLTVQGNTVRVTRNGNTVERALAPGEDALHAIAREFERVHPVKLDGLPRFVGGAVGYLAYDIVRAIEKLPDTATDDLGLPDAAFLLADTLVIFDHAKHRLIVLANAHNTGDPDAAYDDALARIDPITAQLQQPLPRRPSRSSRPKPIRALRSNVTRERFEEMVRAAKEYIAAGDAFQIVLSQRFSRTTTAQPFSIYRALRALNPRRTCSSCASATSSALIGASPEMMVRLEDGTATVRPIAGTRLRGAASRRCGARRRTAGRREGARRARHAGRPGGATISAACAPTARCACRR